MKLKFTALSLGLLLLLGRANQATAVIGTIDQVPAATLLLPYFEVDLNDPNGLTTLFSVNNASATAVLAHVVIWSDLSVPVLDFNIYLTGYDVQSVNLRDIIVNGKLPQTASVGQDPHDTISPQGDFSQDINFASCQGQLPPPTLLAIFTDHLQKALTGLASPLLVDAAGTQLCAGRALGDNIARGYITVDTVNNCTLRFPNDNAYWNADATNQNVLWGDYFYVNSTQNYASGDTLVHIEASTTNPETTGIGQYTFYGRYVNWLATDHREPLSTNFAVRYITGGAFTGGTDLLVWRDSKFNQPAFLCTTRPAWYPLGQEAIVTFDEEENPDVPQSFPISPQPPGNLLTPFPAEAQRTKVNGPSFPVPFQFGWLFLDLNTAVVAAGSNPPEDPRAAQAWVSVTMSAQGRFSVGFDAIQLDSATAPSHTAPGGSSISGRPVE